ncbi:MAG: hypothetical protein Q7R43_03285, partial [Candidatus Daviesbacteria bacterium]|nr:hypothetical protein [Candidatus Daviesbacteria bacterium]
DKKITEANQRLERLEFARNNSESAMTSQHDTQRETIEKDVDIQKISIKNLETFKLFLQGAQEKSKIEEEVLFDVEFENGEVMKDAIFAPLNVGLEKVEIVTAKSPLGEAILGKKVGGKFSYQIGETKVSGNIAKVE